MANAGGRRFRVVNQEQTERRSHTRFPLTLDLRYSSFQRQGPAGMGRGRTIDVSSSGLAFTSDRPPAVNELLTVSIDWPVLLEGGVQLQLILTGEVVRTSGLLVALRIQRHEFRTKALGVKVTPPVDLFRR